MVVLLLMLLVITFIANLLYLSIIVFFPFNRNACVGFWGVMNVTSAKFLLIPTFHLNFKLVTIF